MKGHTLTPVVSALAILAACDTLGPQPNFPEAPFLYATPESAGPGIILDRLAGGTGLYTIIHTSTGDTVISHWKPANTAAKASSYDIAKSCIATTMDGYQALRLTNQTDSMRMLEYDFEGVFSRCVEPHGLKGEQKQLTLPSHFLFGIRGAGSEGAYRAAKAGIPLSQFKSDVASCEMVLRTESRSLVRETRFDPIWTGHAGLSYSATHRTIQPAMAVLKRCTEEAGYVIDLYRH